MLFTPIYIAMTFIKTWRIRSFRSRLLEFLSGNTSVAFCKVPENAAETPTLSSKLCTNPKNAYLCDLLDYTNATRICSMKPNQCIELTDWVSCAGGLPLGFAETFLETDLDVDLLLECEMEPHEGSSTQNIITLESMGSPVAWKAGSHLAIVLRSNIEHLSVAGFHFVGGEFIINHKLPVVRMQTVKLSGEPNKATDPAMRSFRSEIQHGLKAAPSEFQWPMHASLLRKLSKVVDIKTDKNSIEMNGNGCTVNGIDTLNATRKSITLADVSCNTTKSLEENKSPSKSPVNGDDNNVIVENVTVEIQHSITPKKSSLTLDLKKGTSQLSASLLNISSQIKSVTTHKRIVSVTGSKKSQSQVEVSSQDETPKSAKLTRPLINTKSPNVLIYSDSVATRDNLEASLRQVLDCDRYTVYSVSAAALAAGAWRGRAALVAVAGAAGRAAPLLLAHLLDGGRLLALCSDVLHAVLPYYKTAEVRENEVVQFTFDRWKSVKMKHHIFCYQASPAKKQFSTENDRQPSKYEGHPGHSLAISVLASEETWRTPSLLQAVDATNGGVAIFSQIHLEADPADYLTDEAEKTNKARLEILHKIVGELLGLHVQEPLAARAPRYTRGFFLGNHVDKLALIKEWCGVGAEDAGPRLHQLGAVRLQYCLRGEPWLAPPSENCLPVFVHECPEDFNTVDYFNNLRSRYIGRLVLYAAELGSTQALAAGGRLARGVAVAARRQRAGRGRRGNAWISTDGQALITVQTSMCAGAPASLAQHAGALAAVLAARAPPCQDLDIRIKWPNDIYYGREVKIGGNLTNASCYGDEIVLNIGTGVNITNSTPTTCLNDIISEYNRLKPGAKLPAVSVEVFLARYCSALEEQLDALENDVDGFFDRYYQYWLHDNEEIRVLEAGATSPTAGTVAGLDAAGWLRVRTARGERSVAPDGNTFDMMAGLVAPKL